MVESAILYTSVYNGYFLSPQYNVSGTSILGPDSTFYSQPVSSVLLQLSWQEGLNYITAATEDTVSVMLVLSYPINLSPL